MSALPFVMEPKELSALLAQPNTLLLVDLSAPETYQRGHIDGAVNVPPQALLCNQPPAPGRIASEAQLSQLFSELGLTPETHVVVYDDEGGGWAGRFIWTLDAVGHKHYSYLNGGLHAWQHDGLPLSTEGPELEPTEVQVRIDPDVLIGVPTILGELDKSDFVVWDARSAAEYRGEKVLAEKGGHIPGAIHCEWTELMDPAKGLRIREDAREYLASKGLSADKRMVTHCQTHHRSGFTYLVGKSLGFDIKGYHGSWSEWGNHPDTPVEK